MSLSESPSTVPATARRRWPVRSILVGVVFALVLPGVLFCGLLLQRISSVERARTLEAAQSTALRTAETLDRELSNDISALIALATSPALDGSDLAAFGQQVRAAAAALNHEIVLGDVGGQQVINSRLLVAGGAGPSADPAARMGSIETVRRVVATRRPGVTGLFRAGSDGHASLAVVVPVLRGDRVLYVLALNLTPASISRILADQGLPADWTAAVVDGGDQVFARNDARADFAGAPIQEQAGRHAVGERAVWIGPGPEGAGGAESLMAMQRQRVADWRVLVAVPLSVLQAPLQSTIAFLAITGIFALLIAGLLAWQLADTVARPLHRLARAADALGRGEPVDGVSSSIAEVDAVSRALVQAVRDLQARTGALAAERAQLAAILDTAPVGLAIAATDGAIVSANRHLTGMLRSDAAGQGAPGWVVRHPDGRRMAAGEGPLQEVLDGAPTAGMHCICERPDGSTFWTELVAAPIRGAGGAITGGVVAVLDIDDIVRAREAEARFAGDLERQVIERTAALEDANQRLRDEMVARGTAEEQLRQAQKMEAVGQLTGGIAHDFNNLLTIIIGSLDLLRRRMADGPEEGRSRRLLDNALDGAGRAATLTARLLAFSRRQPLSPKPIDANQLVLGMADLLHRTLGEAIHVDTVLAGGLWQTHADPNQLENALLNLAVNARDAMLSTPDGGGTLTISTTNLEVGPGEAGRHPDARPGQYVQLAVADTGAGMTPEIVERVFEPFFTTKPPGQGTGLGLSQVHGFVMQSGGHVQIRSAPGEGTTVLVALPRFIAQEPAAVRTRAHAGGGSAPMTILVVEDEPAVRRLSTEALRELGHAVLEAPDAGSGLRMLEMHPEIDLLFTDVILPQMGGPDLAAEARRRRPDLMVLFTSGYPGDQTARDPRLAGSTLLQKPFDVAGLAEKLDEATAGTGRPG